MKGSRFIHLTTDSISFLFIIEQHSTVYKYISQLLYLHICGWNLGCFPVLAIGSSAAMNIRVHVSFAVMVFSASMPSSDSARSYGRFIPSFFTDSLDSSP